MLWCEIVKYELCGWYGNTRGDDMSDFKKSREIWRQKLAVYAIGRKLEVLSLLTMPHVRGKYTGDPRVMVKGYDRELDSLLSPWRTKIRRLIANRCRSVLAGKKLTPTLVRRLNELLGELNNGLASIPPSLDKARGSLAALIDVDDPEIDQKYDAYCLLRELVPDSLISRTVSAWKKELREHLQAQSRPSTPVRVGSGDPGETGAVGDSQLPGMRGPLSHVFWSSGNGRDVLDAVSRYRFMEVFGIGEFPETQAEIEEMLVEAIGEWQPSWVRRYACHHYSQAVAEDLWHASRSQALCGRMRYFLELALQAISNSQRADGWWASDRRANVTQSHYGTGLACTVLLRLSRSGQQLDSAYQGVKWLAKQQQGSGAWGIDSTRSEPDLLTTLLAAEAVKSSGLDGFDSTISLADSWILSQQREDGTWEIDEFPFPFLTTQVLEYFDRRTAPLAKLDNFLSIARDFLLRSQEFATLDDENSRRLAVVVAFQGLEALLYACLCDRSVNIKIFVNPNETIGMRKALTSLQGHFQRLKVLSRSQNIEYRNELDRLAYLRDQVVHKAGAVSGREAKELAQAGVRFANLQAQRIFGFDLL